MYELVWSGIQMINVVVPNVRIYKIEKKNERNHVYNEKKVYDHNYSP